MYLLRLALLSIPRRPKLNPFGIKPNYNAAAQPPKTHQILSDTQCLLLDPQLLALFDPELYGKSTWGPNGQQVDDLDTLLKQTRVQSDHSHQAGTLYLIRLVQTMMPLPFFAYQQ
ncbi:hypothetical protein N7541_007766 [Penicillium brevicompactum]|uniref:Uncharacterized protein n=1 Tax=Penicillium brevicompactum TaxID=5074 RepID=A0A9W9R045_PENBR|nr:hypothetical protein N7541_007766 [Penicillium brevicompactum]